VEKAHLQDASYQGPSAEAPDPVDGVVRDQCPGEATEHHQREREMPAICEQAAG
jgi:hypothetical protein